MGTRLVPQLILIFGLLFFRNEVYSQTGRMVHVSGTGLHFNNQIIVADHSETAFMAPVSADQTAVIDSNSLFNINFLVNHPSYYKVGRNVMYLCPGDDIVANLDYEYATNANFVGKGAEANEYLKNTPFPKGGSFLQSGKNIGNSLQSALKKILQAAQARTTDLAKCENVSQSFRKLETTRIKADIANSLISIKYYFDEVPNKDSVANFKLEYKAKLDSLIQPYLKGLFEPVNLQLEVVRDIIQSPDFKKFSLTIKQRESISVWQQAESLASRLNNISNKDTTKSLKPAIENIRNAVYREKLMTLYDSKVEYGDGDPAFNFMARDENDKPASLDNLKGSVIYIDVWATWCGPCLADLPAVEKLKQKYAGKNVSIVSLSIDNNIQSWLGYISRNKFVGHQWVINRFNLKEYSVVAVPRGIIIDKNFRIVTLYAPRPSTSQLDKLIQSLLE
jgi:thiol-disulfide isomerase/thioredoxin